MASDLQSRLEVYEDGEWKDAFYSPFNWRCYQIYGFLGNALRNYSETPQIKPFDGTVTLKELLAFDYEQTFWNKIVIENGKHRLAHGHEGSHPTMREYLTPKFFDELDKLKNFGSPEDVRIIFSFVDNKQANKLRVKPGQVIS